MVNINYKVKKVYLLYTLITVLEKFSRNITNLSLFILRKKDMERERERDIICIPIFSGLMELNYER